MWIHVLCVSNCTEASVDVKDAEREIYLWTKDGNAEAVRDLRDLET